MIAFIDDYRAAYEVEPICKVLQIAPSTYHAHAAQRADPAKHSPRAKRDLALMADIQGVFDANALSSRPSLAATDPNCCGSDACDRASGMFRF